VDWLMPPGAQGARAEIGILDHESARPGGSQLVAARIAEVLSDRYTVEFIHSGRGYALADLSKAFDLDLGRVRERVVEFSLERFAIPGPRSLLRDRLRADRDLTERYDVFVYSGHGAPPFCFARRGLVYCHFPFQTRPRLALAKDPRWRSRSGIGRGLRGAVYEWLWGRRLRGYAKILANSRFTAEWIERLWGYPAEVVYPPVTSGAPAATKRDVIVSVGRFIATDHKNVSLQLAAFSELAARTDGDWRLRIIGFCTDTAEDRAHLAGLRERARELPVEFVVNADRTSLLAHLAEAALFWNTTGLSDEEPPEPCCMEHFGIATVEAMAAGCVPLAPAFGGQVEIVEHEVNGFLCADVGELVQHSLAVIRDEPLRARMSRAAAERSRAFEPSVFDEHIRRLVGDLVADRGSRS
jgi:glycosyltransferase involved in cell wall biosynthesis